MSKEEPSLGDLTKCDLGHITDKGLTQLNGDTVRCVWTGFKVNAALLEFINSDVVPRVNGIRRVRRPRAYVRDYTLVVVYDKTIEGASYDGVFTVFLKVLRAQINLIRVTEDEQYLSFIEGHTVGHYPLDNGPQRRELSAMAVHSAASSTADNQS